MPDEHVTDLIPEFALGLLAEGEVLQVARHLPGCPECRRELRSYEAATNGLAFSAPPRMPPPDLKRRILLQIDRSTQAAPQTESMRLRTGITSAPRQFFSRSGSALLGGLALVLILLLGAVNLALWQQTRQQQAQLLSENLRIVHLTGSEKSPQASGFLLVNQNDSSAILIVDNVPILDPSQQFQLWLIRDGKRTSGGVFSTDDSGFTIHQIRSDHPLDTFEAFGITIEPAGGSPGPTGERILGGAF